MLLAMSLLRTTKSASANGKDDKGTVLFTMNDTVHGFTRELIHDKLIDTMYTSRLEELVSNKDCRYALLANFDDGAPLKLSSILPAQLRAIRLEDCSRMELSDDSFSSTRWLGVLEMKNHPMQKLPHSICQLRHLGYLNLSSCSRLVTLPESFGDLLYLLHINLSGCSGLENLPESFGDLVNLLHIDLSGCFGLVNLPESLGRLKKLVHINLAGCSRLVNLPELFGKLINLVHIDLSRCSGLINLPRLFRKLTNLVYIDLSRCSRLQKLPQSFGKLMNLEHIDLSECSGLVNLPRSFGKLIKVPHINLSGCSALVNLPESLGELINLVHIDLSGCSRLVTLPGSFGDLTDLVYINLSRCHGLVNLPQSFRKLEKLEHLDLSFWSCFKVIQTALAGRSNLQHLSLSHPCCSLAQHRPHPEGLKKALGQLTSLKYLNLSMFLNPICDSQSEEKIREYIECISGVPSLEHLDLSHNMFLREVPECLGELNKLHTLDLSGCIRLESIAKRIGEMKSLKWIFVRNCRSLKTYQVVVQAAVDDGAADSSSNLVQLEDADFEELEVSSLEKVKSREDVQRVRLAAKQKLEKLKLCWTVGSQRSMEDNALLGDLVPPHNLKCLELHGYYGQVPACLCDMAWWTPAVSPNLLNLAEVTIDNVWTCNQLPPLGLLPNLQRLVLRRMPSITTIDGYHLSGGNRAALNRLPKFTIEHMDNLQNFNTIYYGAGGEEVMFPDIDELVIQTCPLLMFSPLPPRARMMAISDCNNVMLASWWTGGGRGVEGPRTSAPVTELVVDSCRVMLNQWHLLHHLPGLRSLTIKNCHYLNISPELIRALSSLQTLCFSDCGDMTSVLNHIGGLNSLRELQIKSCRRVSDFPDSMKKLTSLESMHLSRCNWLKVLPEWLGDITSLQKLTIDTCHDMGSLPQSIQKLTNLKDLDISYCDSLKRWCEQEENKKLLAHIPNKTYKEHASTSMPGRQRRRR